MESFTERERLVEGVLFSIAIYIYGKEMNESMNGLRRTATHIKIFLSGHKKNRDL